MNEIIVIQPESLEHLGNAVRTLDNTEGDMLFIDAINSLETTNNDINSQQKIIEDITTIVSRKAAIETTTQKSASTTNGASTKIQENNSKLLELLELADSIPEHSSDVSLTGITDWSYFSHNNSRNNLVNLIKPEDTINATNFEHMLENSYKIANIDNIDTSNATNLDFMLTGCAGLAKLPVGMNLENAETADSVFRDCTGLTSVPEMKTSKLKSHRRMFRGCSGLVAAPVVDTSNSESLEDFLRGCENLTEIPGYNTSKCKIFDAAFMGCKNITNAPIIDTSSAEDFQYMFNDCTGLRYTNVMYNSDKVKNFNYMFANTTSSDMPIRLSSTSNGEKFQYMFQDAALEWLPETLDTHNGKSFTYMYDGCTKMRMYNTHEQPMSLVSAENCQNMFSRTKLDNTHRLCPAVNMTNKCKNAQAMFYDSGIVYIDNLGDTSGVENFKNCFLYCKDLKSIGAYTPLNMSSCTDAEMMFGGCDNLTNINLTGDINTDIDLRWSPLTEQSTRNIINALRPQTIAEGQVRKQVVLDDSLYRLHNLVQKDDSFHYIFDTSTQYHCADYINRNSDLVNMGDTLNGDFKVYPITSSYGDVVMVAPGARYKIPFSVSTTGEYAICVSNFVTGDVNQKREWSHGSKICIDGKHTFNLNDDDLETAYYGLHYYMGIQLTLEAGEHVIELVGERPVGLTAFFKDIYIKEWEPVHNYTYKCCLEYENEWGSAEYIIDKKGWRT